jgi:hypothetical protein
MPKRKARKQRKPFGRIRKLPSAAGTAPHRRRDVGCTRREEQDQREAGDAQTVR